MKKDIINNIKKKSELKHLSNFTQKINNDLNSSGERNLKWFYKKILKI